MEEIVTVIEISDSEIIQNNNRLYAELSLSDSDSAIQIPLLDISEDEIFDRTIQNILAAGVDNNIIVYDSHAKSRELTYRLIKIMSTVQDIDYFIIDSKFKNILDQDNILCYNIDKYKDYYRNELSAGLGPNDTELVIGISQKALIHLKYKNLTGISILGKNILLGSF